MDASTMPLFEEAPMTHGDGGSRGVLELARSAAPVARRRAAALTTVVRPAGEVAALLLVQVLRSPRARAAALGLGRSLARRVAGWRLPSARAGVSTTKWQVTVVEESRVGAIGVLVRRVETALTLPNRAQPPTKW
jgi:hypothetical protein